MSNHKISINDRVVFANNRAVPGTVLENPGKYDTLVKFDDGDLCRVDTEFLTPA